MYQTQWTKRKRWLSINCNWIYLLTILRQWEEISALTILKVHPFSPLPINKITIRSKAKLPKSTSTVDVNKRQAYDHYQIPHRSQMDIRKILQQLLHWRYPLLLLPHNTLVSINPQLGLNGSLREIAFVISRKSALTQAIAPQIWGSGTVGLNCILLITAFSWEEDSVWSEQLHSTVAAIATLLRKEISKW